MTRVIAPFKNFTFQQSVYVFNEDNECIETFFTTTDGYISMIKSLANKYSADKIELIGNEDYLKQCKAELLTQFENNDIEIEIKGVIYYG